MKRLRLAWLALWLGATACSGNVTNNADAGPSDGGSGRACTRTVECPTGEICDLDTMRCATTVTCTSPNHAECGGAAYCSKEGVCKPTQTGAPCTETGNCGGDDDCLGGYCGCGAQFVTGNRVPPNVLIALDRSQSMISNNVPGTNPLKNRWTVAKEAIAALLLSYGGQVRFGLKLWPGTNLDCSGGGDCSAGYIPVDTGENTATTINSTLTSSDTCMQGTPITLAVSSVIDYDGLEDTTRDNFLVLITDGQQMSCTGDPVAAVTSLRMETPELKTFVIGFSGDVDATQLNAMAVAGGTDRTGTTKYFQADSAQDLADAFNEIAASVISCDYHLDTVPPDPDLLFVYFATNPLTRDPTHTNGWDYDAGANEVTFYGTTCATIRAGNVEDLAIVYGCPIIIE